MLTVHIDVWKFYLLKLLDPRDLSRLSACCKRLRCLGESVHPNYKKSKNDALFQACREEHRERAEWLINEKGANDFNWGPLLNQTRKTMIMIVLDIFFGLNSHIT